MALPKTINLDGTTYETDQFSPGVQQAIAIYNTFNEDLQKEQLAVVKTQAALQQIGAQIGSAIKQELEKKEEGPDVEDAEPVPSKPAPEDEQEFASEPKPVFGPSDPPKRRKI